MLEMQERVSTPLQVKLFFPTLLLHTSIAIGYPNPKPILNNPMSRS